MKTLKFGEISRVEGEGSVTLHKNGDQLESVELRIFEPPRFFEAFLQGRDFSEVPDITARICGICPIAYQVSCSLAIERAFGMEVSPEIESLRRLIYCGEWIKSHALHIHLLHLPDFFGFADGIEMSRVYPEEILRGLRIKKAGNRLMEAVGGRAVHPINLRVGGFASAPEPRVLQELVPTLDAALEDAIAAVHWVARIEFPHFEPETPYVAMVHESEYPIHQGKLASSEGTVWTDEEFESSIAEIQVPHSNSLHYRLDGKSYQVGPLARFNLNRERLTPIAHQLASKVFEHGPIRNPFKSVLVRAIETVFALEESLKLIANYVPPELSLIVANPRAAVGRGCSEAPRGICFHSYELAADGSVVRANIVPPTSQNLACIEDDLKSWASEFLDSDELQFECERMVRNFDPCISCATHFLRIREGNEV
ncbi:MAG: Ni/Fe hydrogenase subunit alpha [Armatimonadetes bacterium]|nr:Ni/Fe hydrogenase subunit alpha [Armatimonadota bacterium]